MNINPIATLLNGVGQQTPTMPQMNKNNPMSMITEFAKFKKQMQGKNPQAMVQELIDSGKMSTEQFEQLKEQAQALSSILK